MTHNDQLQAALKRAMQTVPAGSPIIEIPSGEVLIDTHDQVRVFMRADIFVDVAERWISAQMAKLTPNV